MAAVLTGTAPAIVPATSPMTSFPLRLRIRRAAATLLAVACLGAAAAAPAGAAPSSSDEGQGGRTYSAISTDPASPLVLLNAEHPLDPADYAPTELTRVDGAGHDLVPEAADALESLRIAAARAGHYLVVESAYRSYQHQDRLFRQYAAKYGADYASRISARPGTSEHQLGLAADLGLAGGECSLRACLGTLPAGKWMAEHAVEYGFIVRYPADARGITGYNYEPWHLRYIGVERAQDMREAGFTTFEEYSDHVVQERTERRRAARERAARDAERRAHEAEVAAEQRWMPSWARVRYTD